MAQGTTWFCPGEALVRRAVLPGVCGVTSAPKTPTGTQAQSCALVLLCVRVSRRRHVGDVGGDPDRRGQGFERGLRAGALRAASRSRGGRVHAKTGGADRVEHERCTGSTVVALTRGRPSAVCVWCLSGSAGQRRSASTPCLGEWLLRLPLGLREPRDAYHAGVLGFLVAPGRRHAPRPAQPRSGSARSQWRRPRRRWQA